MPFRPIKNPKIKVKRKRIKRELIKRHDLLVKSQAK